LFQGAIEYWRTLTPAEKQVYHDVDPQIGANPAYLNFLRSWLLGTVPEHGDEHGKDGGDPIGPELEEATHPVTAYSLPAAHHFMLWTARPRDTYLPSPCLAERSFAGGQLFAANRLYAIPYPIAATITANRIAIRVNTAVGGSQVRLGCYRDNGYAYPHDLVFDAGLVSSASIGTKTINVSQELTPGLYWLVALSAHTPTLAAEDTDAFGLYGRTDELRYPYPALYHAQAFGALPDPFPSAAPSGQSSFIIISLRFD